ncbi:MAG: LptF/LptG family permease [Hyphomonadaceae bacterium]|nr:LptF/LptG family permease [Hyphomonadaceae bacterium]
MRFLFSGIGLYLASQAVSGFLIAFGAVAATTCLIDIVEHMRQDFPLLAAIQLMALRAPLLMEQTLPFVVLAGAMISMVRLNRSSQLVALRASGVSAWRFLAPCTVWAATLGLLVVTAINPLGTYLYKIYETQRAAIESQNQQATLENGVWLRQGDPQGQIVIHGERVTQNGARLEEATFIFFEERGNALRFARRIKAARADLRPGFWQLSDVTEAVPGERPIGQAHLAIPTHLHPSELLERFVDPDSLSFWSLPAVIREAEQAGLAPVGYEVRWQSLLAYPIMLAAMAGLGAVFSLRLQRLGDLARWGAAGVGLGLLLFFLSQLAAAFAATRAVPPVIAAWSAPLTGVFTALAIVAFLEDG